MALLKFINWLLGENQAISPLLLMVLIAVVTVGVILFLRHQPLRRAQEELSGTSSYKEAVVIGNFFRERKGLVWKGLLIWACLSLLIIPLVSVLAN
ncbi:MAG: hypothetical protein V1806_09975 [Pseudomonadota bacterium]